MNKTSQKWQILNYLQKNYNKEVLASDFVNPSIFSKKPYIWYSANTRISDLKRLWLIKVVWIHKWIKTFLRKSKDRNLYKITIKGLEYKLI